MKKIVSLVLALVLVLAIAAPAMAITGTINPAATTTAYAPYYDIDLVLLESAPSSTGIGFLNLQAVAANKAYVKDSLVHFALYYKTGATGTITMDEDDYAAPVALISSDVVTFLAGAVSYKISSTTGLTNAPSFAQTIATGAKSVQYVLEDPDTTVASYIIIGSGVVSTAANGTILAEILGDVNSVKFVTPANLLVNLPAQITALNGKTIYSSKDVAKYIISAAQLASNTDTIEYKVTTPSTSKAVIFTASLAQSIAAGSSKNLSKIEVVSAAGDKYLVIDQGSVLAGGGTSALKFFDSTGAEVVNNTTNAALIAELTATYTGVMTYFGFNYTAAGVLLPKHFGAKLSVFYANDSAAITLYTSAITVPDEDTDVPQTGDAASSIGFVMIALAIVAAAGVAYKKVRA